VTEKKEKQDENPREWELCEKETACGCYCNAMSWEYMEYIENN
jgi:hypothetical protein